MISCQIKKLISETLLQSLFEKRLTLVLFGYYLGSLFKEDNRTEQFVNLSKGGAFYFFIYFLMLFH